MWVDSDTNHGRKFVQHTHCVPYNKDSSVWISCATTRNILTEFLTHCWVVCLKFTTIPWTMFRLYNGSHEMSLAQECHAKLLEFFLWIFWPTFNHIFCDIAFFLQSFPSPGAHGFHDHWPCLPGFYLFGSKRMYHSSCYKNTRRLEPFQSHEVFKI